MKHLFLRAQAVFWILIACVVYLIALRVFRIPIWNEYRIATRACTLTSVLKTKDEIHANMKCHGKDLEMTTSWEIAKMLLISNSPGSKFNCEISANDTVISCK